tara:strand:+ start:2984 stop:3421 length:438 start_codon:yes stop_codon:yes gene_type:complete
VNTIQNGNLIAGTQTVSVVILSLGMAQTTHALLGLMFTMMIRQTANAVIRVSMNVQWIYRRLMMKYFRVKQTSRRDSVLGCVRPVNNHKENLSGFVGETSLEPNSFGYFSLTGNNGIIIVVQNELLEPAEEFDYETCQEYEKVML